MSRLLLLFTTLLLTGCAGQYQSKTTAINHLYNYQIFHFGKPISLQQLNDALSDADVILIGELHSHSAIHRFQTELLSEFHRNGEKITLAMEQFSRDKQSVLNQYLSGELGEEKFITESDAWSNYRSDYRPLIELSKMNTTNVVAANAPNHIVRCINRKGIEYINELDKEQRQQIAASFDTTESLYKEKFRKSMYHGDDEQFERLYAAQISRDETMAESIVLAMGESRNQKIVLTAGKFHTEEGLGVGAAIGRRDSSLNIAVIEPVFEMPVDKSTQFQLLVQRLPEAYLEGETRNFHFNKPSTHTTDCDTK